MIIYFCDRSFNVLGRASTSLPKGLQIINDKHIEEIETGTSTLEFTLPFSKSERQSVEEMTAEGNYIIRHSKNGDDQFYTIIDVELDTAEREVEIYAEDAGLDLLNHVVPKFPDAQMGDDDSDTFTANIAWYMNKWLYDTGFEIGVNEIGSTMTKRLSANESTLTERILEIAKLFEAEIGFSFKIEDMQVTKKLLNIYKKRGNETETRLYLGREIKKITVTTSISDIATALQVVGGNNSAGVPVTLDGLTYDDGDFYIDARPDYPSTATQKVVLYSRQARRRWSRYRFDGEPGQLANGTGDVIKVHRSDIVDQTTLRDAAIAELKKKREPARNYKCDFYYLPDGVKLGDTVSVIDDEGNMYLSARVLKIEESEYDDTRTATLGNYLIKDSGIYAEVAQLAKDFSMLADRSFYTWIVYADNASGLGISKNPAGKAYMGLSSGHLTEDPDITDPSIYKFSLIKGQDAQNLSIRLRSSAGFITEDEYINSTMTASIYIGSRQLTSQEISDVHGVVTWYIGTTQIGTGVTFTLPVDTYDESFTLTAIFTGDGNLYAAENYDFIKVKDVAFTYTYYKKVLNSDGTPAQPTPPSFSGWLLSAPAFAPGDADYYTVYTCVVTEYSDGTYSVGDVTVAPYYETGKIAKSMASDAAKTATDFIVEASNDGTILIHPEGDTSVGVRIKDNIEIIRDGQVVATYSDAAEIGSFTGGTIDGIYYPVRGSKMTISKEAIDAVSRLSHPLIAGGQVTFNLLHIGRYLSVDDGNLITHYYDMHDLSHPDITPPEHLKAPQVTLLDGTPGETRGAYSFSAGRFNAANNSAAMVLGASNTALGQFSNISGGKGNVTGHDFPEVPIEPDDPDDPDDPNNPGVVEPDPGEIDPDEGDIDPDEGGDEIEPDPGDDPEPETYKPDPQGQYASIGGGQNNEAIGNYSHIAGGKDNYAKNAYTFLYGEGLYATEDDQFVIGKYNEDGVDYDELDPTTERYDVERDTGDYSFIIGNGTDNTHRKNAFAVGKNGVPFARDLADNFGSIFELIYPVGAIYLTVDNTDPATFFGGTWDQIKADRLSVSGTTIYYFQRIA
jgi:phage minor structural protein